MGDHFDGVTTKDTETRHGWPRRRVIMSCDASRGPLLIRYFLIQTRWFAVYLHHLKADDEDRALHDHPWSFVTFLFHRGYWEFTPAPAEPKQRDRFVVVPGNEPGWWHVQDLDESDRRGAPWLVRHYGPNVPAEVFAESNAKDMNRAEEIDRIEGRLIYPPDPVRTWRRRFSILWRPAEWKHRLELDRGRPTWTLVVRFRKRREWGFDVPGRGWLDWRAYGKEWCD